MESTSAAVIAVFSTTELAEAVFDRIDPFDLVRATAVCTKFRDTILGSASKRQCLFLEPRWADPIHPMDDLARKPAHSPWACPAPALPIYAANPIVQSFRTLFRSTFVPVGLPLLLMWKKTDSPWLRKFVTQPPTRTLKPRYVSKESGSLIYNGSTATSIERSQGVRWVDVLECFFSITGKSV